MRVRLIILIATIFATANVSAQPIAIGSGSDSVINNINTQKWTSAVEKKVSRLEEKMIAKSRKTLHKLQEEEEKINRKLLVSKDSLTAKAQLAEIRNRYAALQQQLNDPLSAVSANNVREYVPYLDTLKSAFKFLEKQGQTGNVKDALSKVQSFEGRLQQADEIKRFIRERKEQLKQQLENLGLVKDMKKFSKEIFYYAEQIKEYKAILNDPKKIERKALDLLSKTKEFKDFFAKNSMLVSLFRMPGADPNDPNYIAGLSGLQTRAQVNNLIQQQIAAGGPDAQQQFRQNLQDAQSQLQQLKDKVNKWGGGSSDDIMPEGFRRNDQRVKNFWKRIDLGANMQTQRATNVFPIVSDIGVSLGYKPNDKSIIGIGASYKMGWGTGWNNIRITHQGVGLRSYADIKLKGSFWISGGYEQNLRSEIRNIDQLRDRSAWSNSGLVGMSKVVSVKSKLFKKTKVQVLWDFLSYEQKPRTQPIVFRIGYTIK